MARNTRERIIQAFFELALNEPSKARFSLAEIAKQAAISRQAIYKNHFNSIEEIIEEIHQILYAEFSTALKMYDPAVEPDPFVFFAEQFVPVFYNHRKWVRCLYITAADPSWIPFLASVLLEFQSKHVRINHEELQVPKKKAAQLLVKGVMGLLEVWISQPEPTPPQQFAQTFLSVINFPISNYVITEEEQSPVSPPPYFLSFS